MPDAAEIEFAAEALAEQLFVGAVLSNDRERGMLLDLCQPGLIRDPFHRRIIDEARAAHRNGDRISAATMRIRLANDPAWSSIATDYLDRLEIAATPHRDGPTLIRRMRQEMHRFPADGRTPYFLYHATGVVEDPAALDYLIKGIWAPGELSALYGEPGSAKSFLVLYLAYMVALGRPTLGRRARRAPVLIAALEGQHGFHRRVLALADIHGPAHDLFWTTQPLDLFSVEADVPGLVDSIVKVGAKLLVIDTLSRATPGGRENESGDMGQVIAATDFIRRETGAHVCLVHHSGKDSNKGMRGHSSLLAAVDVALEIRRDGSARSVRLAKVKDGRDGDEHAFALKVIDLGCDDDGDPVTTCVVSPSDLPPEPRKAKLTGQTKLAFDLLVQAINDEGTKPPADVKFPRDINVCPVPVWRERCFRGFGFDRDNAETNRRTFNRALTNLKNLNRINVWDDLVWIVQ